MPLCDFQYVVGHRRGKKKRPFFGICFAQYRFNVVDESHIQHFISFIQHRVRYIFKTQALSPEMVHYPAGRSDDDVDTRFNVPHLFRHGLPAIYRQYPDFFLSLERVYFIGNIASSWWHRIIARTDRMFVYCFDKRQPEGRVFRSRSGPVYNINIGSRAEESPPPGSVGSEILFL